MITSLPQHIAIIPDGNRRWAKEHGLPVVSGHQKGYEVFEPIILHAIECHIPYLTFWAFSTENWKRTPFEIDVLMTIFRNMFRSDLMKRLHEYDARLKIIGDFSKFPSDIVKDAEKIIKETENNKTITISIGLNYGGRQEIISAVNQLLKEGITVVDEKKFAKKLYTAGVPDPDLIIRTSGEYRLSGFMPWQSVYSELYFVPTYWPDFTPSMLDNAIEEYGNRQRRQGK